MIKKKLIIFGAGGHANSCTQIIKKIGDYQIIGYIDKVKKNKYGFKVIGDDLNLKTINKYYLNII